MMEEGLLEKTGQTLAHWIKVVEGSKFDKHKGIVDFLKSEHGFTHGFANFVALKAKKSDAGSFSPEALIKTQYTGKEQLRPIYDSLVDFSKSLGEDVEVVPKKDSVSIKRKKQFILIKPATKSRIDLGVKLKDVPITDRLESSGPFGAMCTHRVRLEKIEQVDSELKKWITEAYNKAG